MAQYASISKQGRRLLQDAESIEVRTLCHQQGRCTAKVASIMVVSCNL